MLPLLHFSSSRNFGNVVPGFQNSVFCKYSGPVNNNPTYAISHSSLVYIGPCYFLLKVYVSRAQTFLTAGNPDATDLAKCHKGVLKHVVNIVTVLQHRVLFGLFIFVSGHDELRSSSVRHTVTCTSYCHMYVVLSRVRLTVTCTSTSNMISA